MDDRIRRRRSRAGPGQSGGTRPADTKTVTSADTKRRAPAPTIAFAAGAPDFDSGASEAVFAFRATTVPAQARIPIRTIAHATNFPARSPPERTSHFPAMR